MYNEVKIDLKECGKEKKIVECLFETENVTTTIPLKIKKEDKNVLNPPQINQMLVRKIRIKVRKGSGINAAP